MRLKKLLITILAISTIMVVFTSCDYPTRKKTYELVEQVCDQIDNGSQFKYVGKYNAGADYEGELIYVRDADGNIMISDTKTNETKNKTINQTVYKIGEEYYSYDGTNVKQLDANNEDVTKYFVANGATVKRNIKRSTVESFTTPKSLGSDEIVDVSLKISLEKKDGKKYYQAKGAFTDQNMFAIGVAVDGRSMYYNCVDNHFTVDLDNVEKVELPK